jgi:hypothetical protein
VVPRNAAANYRDKTDTEGALNEIFEKTNSNVFMIIIEWISH